MVIRCLEITGVRNLRQIDLSNLAQINIIHGLNGSGKTSVLESIHLLSLARSFRSHKLKPLISNDLDQCTVYGEVATTSRDRYQPIGVQRSRNNAGVIKVDGNRIRTVSLLAEKLPLQIINANTFSLLDGSPLTRRQFLDWGVFHVEHNFHVVWKSVQRCLKQRNSLLRHAKIGDAELSVWTAELVRASEQLDGLRARYIEQFTPIFEQCLSRLIDLEGLELSYRRGWDKERSFADVCASNLSREKEQGYTVSGPHKADLRIRYQGHLAADILSRGQQKLVACALRVAQGYLLSQLSNRQCVYLVDDLPAELDKKHRQSLCALLDELDCQVFITCVDQQDLEGCWSDQTTVKMFHVEHGKIIDG